MRGRLLVLVLVAGLVLPAPGGAAVADGHVTASPAADAGQLPAGAVGVHITRDDGATRRTLKLPGLAGLPARPAPAQLRAAWLEQVRMAVDADESAGEGSETVAAGGGTDIEVAAAPDLDGDGEKDLLSVVMDGEKVIFQGLRGLTGSPLWEHAETGQYGYVIPGRVGPEGSRGLIATTVTFEGGEDPENPNFTTTMVLTALAADGVALWSHTYNGSGTATPTGFVYQGLAYPGGLGQLTESPSDEVLLAVMDGADTPLNSSSHAQIQVLDASDGATAATAEVLATEGWIGAGVIGDLDGDGMQDFATAASQGGGQNSVAAHRGADGSSLWQTTTGGGLVWGVGDAGDTDGDAVPDLLVLGFDDDSFAGTTALLAGTDGAVRWQGRGDYAVAVRDVTGDGLADVAFQNSYDGFESDDPEQADRFGVRYLLRSGADGSVVYRRTYAVEFGDAGGMGMVGLYGPAGDADGDRRLDMAHEASVMSFDGSTQDNSGVVRSRDGRRTLRRGIGTPLMARVDARGQDFVLTDEKDRLLRIRVRDGRTGRRIWHRLLPQPRDNGYVAVSAADVAGNRRAEVIVVVPRKSGPMVYVLLSGRGRTLWRG